MAACAGPAVRQDIPPTTWRDHSARLEAVDAWTAIGKLALRSESASETAALVWRQAGGETRVRLSGPLGVGASRIYSDGQVLDIRRGDERRVIDISTPRAIERNTGWDLPLQALPYWLRGLPAPGTDVESLRVDPATGLVQQLRQRGWRVDYGDYQRFHDLSLPTRVSMEKGETRARVVIREWQCGAG